MAERTLAFLAVIISRSLFLGPGWFLLRYDESHRLLRDCWRWLHQMPDRVEKLLHLTVGTVGKRIVPH